MADNDSALREEVDHLRASVADAARRGPGPDQLVNVVPFEQLGDVEVDQLQMAPFPIVGVVEEDQVPCLYVAMERNCLVNRLTLESFSVNFTLMALLQGLGSFKHEFKQCFRRFLYRKCKMTCQCPIYGIPNLPSSPNPAQYSCKFSRPLSITICSFSSPFLLIRQLT
jgi:hypothetical protein